MQHPSRLSRREFVQVSALAAGAASVSLHAPAQAADKPAAKQDPDKALAQLLDGNKRFVEGKLTHPGRKPADFSPLAEGQTPRAVIFGCADSRVSPELIFDQGVGDLFVVRVAGNVVGGAGATVKGSIEYAIAELGVRLVMVLGHSRCGAVKAAVAHIDANDVLPGSIGDLVDLIKPSVAAAKGKPGNKVDNVIRANVRRSVVRLKALDPILAAAVKKGTVKVVGGVYDLHSGKVELLEG